MIKKTITLSEQEFKKLVYESVKNILKENDSFSNDEPSNTHYAVSKLNGKILFSWEYGDIEPSELREFKHDYFTQDLIDNELNPKTISILNRKTCIRKGIDPTDNSNWANHDEMMQSYMGELNEAFSDLVQSNNVMAGDVYNSYVLIDNSDESLLGTYYHKDDAINDANEYARNNKYGSYSVVGCIGKEYDLDNEEDIIYVADSDNF